MEKRPVILDGDPGHDDAIAWVLASASKELDIKAITTVAGNQTAEKVTNNALRICALLGLNVPVASGRERPLVGSLLTAGNFHGESGLDGAVLPEPTFGESTLSAVSLMAKVIKKSDTPVTIIATGPLTNVGSLLLAHPELKTKIREISIMGGGFHHGNWTASAEFNIYEDAEAADVVFKSGIPLTVCGLDVTEKAMITTADRDRIRSFNNPVSSVVADWLTFFFKHYGELGYDGAPLHDPCAVMVLIHPDIFEIKDVHVEVETKGEYCRGAVIGDFLGVTGKKPNVHAVMNVNRDAFMKYLYEACRSFGE